MLRSVASLRSVNLKCRSAVSIRSVVQKSCSEVSHRSEVWLRNVKEKRCSDVSIRSVDQKFSSELPLVSLMKGRSEVSTRSVARIEVLLRSVDQKCRSEVSIWASQCPPPGRFPAHHCEVPQPALSHYPINPHPRSCMARAAMISLVDTNDTHA